MFLKKLNPIRRIRELTEELSRTRRERDQARKESERLQRQRAYGLVVGLRDAAVERLKRAMPAHSADIDRVLVGRKPDGTNDCQPEKRVRIIPFSSVGHIHADHRSGVCWWRYLRQCSLRPDDVQWAFSGLDVVAPDTGEALATLIRTGDGDFLRNYGVEDDNPRSLWRTVTLSRAS